MAAYLFLWPLCRALDTVPALDDIGLEAYRPRSAVQLEEQAASIAEHRTQFISTPKRSCRSGAVLANRLSIPRRPVSECIQGFKDD